MDVHINRDDRRRNLLTGQDDARDSSIPFD